MDKPPLIIEITKLDTHPSPGYDEYVGLQVQVVHQKYRLNDFMLGGNHYIWNISQIYSERTPHVAYYPDTQKVVLNVRGADRDYDDYKAVWWIVGENKEYLLFKNKLMVLVAMYNKARLAQEEEASP